MSNDEEQVILAELYELAEAGAVDWRDELEADYGNLEGRT
jgi:hypothetical protein